jgi:hypothetical protein
MSKTVTSNHFFGGSGGGDAGGGGVLGANAFSGVCCVPCILSPMVVLSTPLTMFGCVCWLVGVLGVKLWAGIWPLKFSLDCCLVATKGCVGVCCVLVMRSTGALVGGVEAGLFEGVFI